MTCWINVYRDPHLLYAPKISKDQWPGWASRSSAERYSAYVKEHCDVRTLYRIKVTLKATV